jgi:transketolase N-terminal domain/subunit
LWPRRSLRADISSVTFFTLRAYRSGSARRTGRTSRAEIAFGTVGTGISFGTGIAFRARITFHT